MTKDEALQMCLEYIETNAHERKHVRHAIQAALAQPAQEPVAWTLLLTGEHHGIIGKAGEQFLGHPKHYERVDVYTTPPKREWVGLTPEETKGFTSQERTLAKYVSKVLQEKNA
jgi:hypothetical protein